MPLIWPLTLYFLVGIVAFLTALMTRNNVVKWVAWVLFYAMIYAVYWSTDAIKTEENSRMCNQLAANGATTRLTGSGCYVAAAPGIWIRFSSDQLVTYPTSDIDQNR